MKDKNCIYNLFTIIHTRIVLLLESLLCWWAELRTMLRHLNRRGLNGITWVLLTVYNLQCIIRTDKANFVESPVILLRRLSSVNASGSSFPHLELAIVFVLTDGSINVKEKRIIHCKLYTVKSTQVLFHCSKAHFNNESKCCIEGQSDYQCFCSHGNNSSRGWLFY
jgi:hypothetical protein